MSAAAPRVSSAVRSAREDDFDQGVRFATLEYQQSLETPSLRGSAGAGMLVRVVKALAMGAPFFGLVAPFGGADTGAFVALDAFDPDTARMIAMWCFWIGSAGQLWVLVDWLRHGRQRDTGWRIWSAVAVVSAAIAAWWHISLAPPPALPALLVPIALTGVLGLVSLVAQLVASTAETRKAGMLRALGERLRTLPADEQAALLDERTEILAALRSRGLIDEALAQRAAATPLGDWWTLDGGLQEGGSTRA